eukprot:gene10209-11105_t
MHMASLLRLPTLFLSHGIGPAHALDYRGTRFSVADKNSPSADFLRSLPQRLEEYAPISAIKAILVVTSHWEEREFAVDYQDSGPTKLVYDYYDFDRRAYAPHLTYPAPTDLRVADRAFQLLQAAGVPAKKMNRGFDHGTFMPLLVSFPEAKIPVVQLSLKEGLDPAEHFRLGEILRPLREEGVLIIGSGSFTLGNRELSPSEGERKAKEFVDHLHNALISIRSAEDYQRFKQIFFSRAETNKAFPHFDLMHSRTEHFVPLLVALAAGVNFVPEGEGAVVNTNRLYTEMAAGTLAMDCYLFQ